MKENIFKFKQFEVRQSSSAMKVGTDGVLLGAWAAKDTLKGISDGCLSLDSNINILDIGSGTGLISLIMAQNLKHAIIKAVEVDIEAANESKYNFEKSDWTERLSIEMSKIQNFTENSENHKKFEIIISNPPYFIDSLKNSEQSKLIARHTELLPYEELAQSVEKLLSDDGNFYLILPYEESSIFVVNAASFGLYLRKRVDVYGSTTTKIKRSMMMFKREKGDTQSSQIAIRQGDGFTQKYIELTKSLYLKF
ncbi:MAG: methyltransferase [Rikenellaceae bacterium]